MQCVTPMFRTFPLGKYKEGKIISRTEALQDLYKYGNIEETLKHYAAAHSCGIEKIPCSKCWACQLNYSAEWATRIMLEAKEDPEQCWFITLTYNDKTVPILSEIDITKTYKMYGEIIDTEKILLQNDGTWKNSLFPEDMTKFIKSLRKPFERKGIKGIKYLYCGEYGETTERPHYHIILLHCPLDISQFYDTHIDANWKEHWKSPEIEKHWKHGIIDICHLEWSCAAYVARYCTKKLSYNKDDSIYYEQGRLPEFINMSKGIGFKYFEEHKEEIYKNDEIIMKTIKGNTGSYKPPKAFDRRYKDQNEEAFEKIKKKRKKIAERSDKNKKTKTNYTELERLIINADKIHKKMNMLPRQGQEGAPT